MIGKMPLSLVMNAFDISTSMPAITIMRDEFMIQLTCRQNTLSDDEINESINSIEAIVCELTKYKLSWLDRLSVYCRAYVQSYSYNQSQRIFSMPAKLKLCAWFYHHHNESSGSGAMVEINRAKLLSFMLHEPGIRVKRLIVRNRCWSWYLKKKRHFYYSDNVVTSRSTHQWSQRGSYQHYIQTSSRSRVLVTMHMGDFIGALREVSMAGADDRRVITLRQGEDLDAIRGVIKQKDRHQVFNRKDASPLKIISKLREKNVTLVALTDLNQHFGEVATIKFMGVDMGFVKGPVTMAILGNADIVPVISYHKDGRDHMDMGPILTPHVDGFGALDLALNHYMQTLFYWFERYVRLYPEQWKYLPDCHSYLSPNS